MTDRLALINQRVTESEKDIAEIARILGYERQTIYNWLANPKLSKQKIAWLGHAIGYDFSKDFDDLKGYHFNFEGRQYIVGEPLPVYGNTSKEDFAELKNEVSILTQMVITLTKEATNNTEWQKAMDIKMAILQDTLNRLIKGMN